MAFMKGIIDLYKPGRGPSSSHTLGPAAAAERFLEEFPGGESFDVELFGSLAATGRGHLTDQAITDVLGRERCTIQWYPDKELPEHPNGMRLSARDAGKKLLGSREVYSVGGGSILYPGLPEAPRPYEHESLAAVLTYCAREEIPLWNYAYLREPGLEEHLRQVWEVMKKSIQRGLLAEGRLPGGLKLPRKASQYMARVRDARGITRDLGRLFANALAVSEENAAGGIVVTAPTCGASGVVPAVLAFYAESHKLPNERIYRALAVAGLIGILVRHNASISGAEVGCQGEVGTACAMAAAAAAHLIGGTRNQVEYAAEMGLEHHLGLTCDPVQGLVQIPCIERNAMAAARAVESAVYALQSDGSHSVSFDQVVETMYRTGRDLGRDYRETSGGGLARTFRPFPGERG
ncbi:L-serine ammonia-lyase [Marispirochaeta aestuarii]|nr:L-serine ammonia-lyase [Marispirochaeta aestuarii]